MYLLLAALLTASIQYEDLPPPARTAIAADASAFDSFLADIKRTTQQRLLAGDREHLAYFILQSTSFTNLAPIEPAASAKQLHQTKSIPPDVQARMDAFIAALQQSPKGERLQYFASVKPEGLRIAYNEAMDFLYRKEFESKQNLNRIASLYESRGYSSDTSIEATFPVYLALKRLPRANIKRVLIIGPGLDFAPRTALFDKYPPQSYQPYAVADALLSLGLTKEQDLQIDCLDINPNVVQFFDQQRAPQLHLPIKTLSPEHNAYTRQLGRKVGVRSGNQLTIRRSLARRISATTGNILTDRLPHQYDLIIATNVLAYMPRRELLLALANVHAALAPGGWFIHNDLREDVEAFTKLFNFEPQYADMIALSESATRGIFDAFVMHRKQP